MSNLIFRPWSGAEREFHFVGYNRNHTVFFVRDGQCSRQAVALQLPTLFRIQFRENPICDSGSIPVEIQPAALHLPACFSSKHESEAFRNPNSNEILCAHILGHGVWKAVTRHKCWLEPRHDKDLSELLRQELDGYRQLHAIREEEIASQIAALPRTESSKAKELRQTLRGQFTTFREGTNGIEYISIFETTLEMARAGWGGLREKVLEREWAKHYGLHLKTIRRDAAAFRIWLQRSAYNTRQSITNLNTRTVENGFALALTPGQWETVEAAIMYEIRFANGSRCWLDDVEVRGIVNVQEVEDFDRFEKAEHDEFSKIKDSPSPITKPMWYSEGFATVRRCNGRGEVVETLPLPNEIRALCQLLAERPDNIGQFSEIEPQIGTRTNQMDSAANVAKPARKGARRVRDVLRTKTACRLREWGVLTVTAAGREKFLKLSPPISAD